MKEIKGNAKQFASINTIEYNWDGEYLVLVTSYSELGDIGWDTDEKYPTYTGSGMLGINDMGVGTVICGEEKGVYLMRVA